MALAGWLSWLEHYPIYHKVAGSIPSQGTYRGQLINVSVSLSLPILFIKSINISSVRIFFKEVYEAINDLEASGKSKVGSIPLILHQDKFKMI